MFFSTPEKKKIQAFYETFCFRDEKPDGIGHVSNRKSGFGMAVSDFGRSEDVKPQRGGRSSLEGGSCLFGISGISGVFSRR